MRDGRLDEAYELVQDARLRAHRRGQDLVGRLARAFVDRGRQHLAERRWPQALTDCEKAAKLGGNLADAAELHQAAREAASRQQDEDHRRADMLETARREVDNGRLSMCAGILAGIDADSAGVAKLRHRADAFRAEAEAHLERARASAAAGRWDDAIESLIAARERHVSNKALAELCGRVIAAVTEEISGAINSGRLDRAEVLVQRLRPLAGETVALTEAACFLGQCRQALAEAAHGRLRAAGEIFRRIAAMRPEAGWIRDARQAADQAAQGLEELRGGPLGLLTEMVTPPESRPMKQSSDEPQPARPDDTVRLHHGDRLPSRFMLYVDGAGSYLVARERCVTIGPVSSSQRPDIGLAAEPGLPTATIERIDEDYFLVSRQPVAVNDRPVTRKLLANGDTIALSPRCRLKFNLPTAASTTAVLQLAGARLPSGDVRRVILLDRTLVMGPGPSAHIQADALSRPIVLTVHDDRLVCRSEAEVKVDDRPLRRSEGIPVDAHVKVDAVAFVARRV
ncbi:MAG TPA: hypothetical protein VLM89_04265 [Phycisphaerae bacterium]|nr:hypothetical protein [Phycisphaerae bacterium]